MAATSDLRKVNDGELVLAHGRQSRCNCQGGLTAAKALGDVTCPLRRRVLRRTRRHRLQRLTASPRCSAPKTRPTANGLAEPVADLIVSLAGDYEHILVSAGHNASAPRTSCPASRPSGCDGDLRRSPPSWTGDDLRTPDLRRQRDADGEDRRRQERSSPSGLRPSTPLPLETARAPVETRSPPPSRRRSLEFEWVEDKVAETDRPS